MGSVFARISSTLARGNTSTASNLGYEIINANRLKLGRNNNISLDNIHELIVKPDKWMSQESNQNWTT